MLTSEVDEEFYKYELIKARFENWKGLNLSTYQSAYVLLSLPKLFSPLIRCELAIWNPLKVKF